jgi:hypothetical protein
MRWPCLKITLVKNFLHIYEQIIYIFYNLDSFEKVQVFHESKSCQKMGMGSSQ